MQHVVYSFDPRAGESTDEERRDEAGGRHLGPERREARWQHDDGDAEARRVVEAIVRGTRPLRLRA